MQSYQQEFIDLAICCDALRFGEFTLKSGRISPYFFNAGQFQSGRVLSDLGRFYAKALLDSGVKFDMLFGPAYKGIPLAVATAIALSNLRDMDTPYCFNRKEAKNHGEGGTLVGAPLQGKVVIVDDVITAGTAVLEALALVKQAGAQASAILLGLNRQERGQGEKSAIEELQENTGVPVISIIKLDDIVTFLTQSSESIDTLQRVKDYRRTYGV